MLKGNYNNMKSKLINTLLAIIAICLISGCKNVTTNDENCVQKTNRIFFGGFGDEHYIWENFFFSTNVVNEVK